MSSLGKWGLEWATLFRISPAETAAASVVGDVENWLSSAIASFKTANFDLRNGESYFSRIPSFHFHYFTRSFSVATHSVMPGYEPSGIDPGLVEHYAEEMGRGVRTQGLVQLWSWWHPEILRAKPKPVSFDHQRGRGTSRCNCSLKASHWAGMSDVTWETEGWHRQECNQGCHSNAGQIRDGHARRQNKVSFMVWL